MLIKLPPRQTEKPKLQKYLEPLVWNEKYKQGYLPECQLWKFTPEFSHLLDLELQNEAREAEDYILTRDVFKALHSRNIMMLLRALQGDRSKLFYQFKDQLLKLTEVQDKNGNRTGKLEFKHKPDSVKCKMIELIRKKEVSLVTLVCLK